MEEKIRDSIVYWNNTQKAFRSQHTQLEGKVAQLESEIKAGLRIEDPLRKRYLDCKVISDSCKTKIGLLKGYLTKLSELATLAPDNEGFTVEARLANWEVPRDEDCSKHPVQLPTGK